MVERRSEEQGVEAGSSATQLAARQSVVPLLRRPAPTPSGDGTVHVFGPDRAVCGGSGYPLERRVQRRCWAAPRFPDGLNCVISCCELLV